MSWHQFDEGKTIGQKGSEGGETLLDEEHQLGARITVEKIISRPPNYFAITCGNYGWFFHTYFVSPEAQANIDYEEMKSDLDKILKIIPNVGEDNDENMARVSDEISKFVDKFPS
jgi:hypothetical protein